MKGILSAALALAFAGMLAVPLNAHDDEVTLTARMLGGHEVPPINSPATGKFKATIHRDGSIDFTLTYANLTSLPIFSHIHFGQFNVAGGVMIFLCGGGGQPACPQQTSGTITGTIAAANVVGPAAQGVTAGDLVSALRIVVDQGEGYANLHTTKFPAGEIRGQVIVRHE